MERIVFTPHSGVGRSNIELLRNSPVGFPITTEVTYRIKPPIQNRVYQNSAPPGQALDLTFTQSFKYRGGKRG